MPQEVRDIILSLEEVQVAFECYQRIAPDFLPKGTIISCSAGDASIILTVEMVYGGSTQQSQLSFKGVDVLRPLIRFCIENNIMLPRDGKKTFFIEKDKVVLHIELNLGEEMQAVHRPLLKSEIALIHTDKDDRFISVAGRA